MDLTIICRLGHFKHFCGDDNDDNVYDDDDDDDGLRRWLEFILQ